jgi:chromosome segregation ATPase
MKMKIQDLKDEISSLGKKKQETICEMQKDESSISSLHSRIQLLQIQKQKLEQSKGEKEVQIDIYSEKIEGLAKKKKTLEDALVIVEGSV